MATYFSRLSPEQLEMMMANLKERADEVGLPLNPPGMVVNSRKALALAEYARDQGALERLHLPLFQAYFVAGENLSDEGVLRRLATEVGLDADAALQAVADGRYQQRLAESAQQARAYGVTGVPTWIINDRYKLVGAQPYEQLREVFRRMMQEG